MDYFNDAFYGFAPQNDSQAAVKFVINNMLMDDRLTELICLLTDGHDTGGVEGEPGWLVERRDIGKTGDMRGYDDWPDGATFRAYVDPASFELAYPEQFLTSREFHSFVRDGVMSYLLKNPSQRKLVDLVISKLAS